MGTIKKWSFKEWAIKVKLLASIVRIVIGIILGATGMYPIMYNAFTKALNEVNVRNELFDFITLQYKIDCVMDDIQNFPDDLRAIDLEVVLNLWELTSDNFKTPGLKFKVNRIENFYIDLTGG